MPPPALPAPPRARTKGVQQPGIPQIPKARRPQDAPKEPETPASDPPNPPGPPPPPPMAGTMALRPTRNAHPGDPHKPRQKCPNGELQAEKLEKQKLMHQAEQKKTGGLKKAAAVEHRMEKEAMNLDANHPPPSATMKVLRPRPEAPAVVDSGVLFFDAKDFHSQYFKQHTMAKHEIPSLTVLGVATSLSHPPRTLRTTRTMRKILLIHRRTTRRLLPVNHARKRTPGAPSERRSRKNVQG
ncbi:hypothetical protein C8J57DRAFT_688343 [Mycena rebaudengoi]|nr:hypothetical protein C8J57DRAFT_688343 [Mycena rebaudengoi]